MNKDEFRRQKLTRLLEDAIIKRERVAVLKEYNIKFEEATKAWHDAERKYYDYSTDCWLDSNEEKQKTLQ